MPQWAAASAGEEGGWGCTGPARAPEDAATPNVAPAEGAGRRPGACQHLNVGAPSQQPGGAAAVTAWGRARAVAGSVWACPPSQKPGALHGPPARWCIALASRAFLFLVQRSESFGDLSGLALEMHRTFWLLVLFSSSPAHALHPCCARPCPLGAWASRVRVAESARKTSCTCRADRLLRLASCFRRFGSCSPEATGCRRVTWWLFNISLVPIQLLCGPRRWLARPLLPYRPRPLSLGSHALSRAPSITPPRPPR